jgi:hypothetical protein
MRPTLPDAHASGPDLVHVAAMRSPPVQLHRRRRAAIVPCSAALSFILPETDAADAAPRFHPPAPDALDVVRVEPFTGTGSCTGAKETVGEFKDFSAAG